MLRIFYKSLCFPLFRFHVSLSNGQVFPRLYMFLINMNKFD